MTIKMPGIKEIENLILLSLFISGLRIFLSLLAQTFEPFTPIFWGHIVALFLLGGQIYFLARRNRIAWMLSVVQLFVTYKTGRGSFGYILTYLWDPFKSNEYFYPFVATGIMLLAELGKTYFMYYVTSGKRQQMS
ncbi:MAG: hypothetical protein AB7T49_06980 [Oligoflexales bacterium]